MVAKTGYRGLRIQASGPDAGTAPPRMRHALAMGRDPAVGAPCRGGDDVRRDGRVMPRITSMPMCGTHGYPSPAQSAAGAAGRSIIVVS
jgi:hypothetical protein